MNDLYHVRQPGDILRLHVPIGDVEPNTYVLLSIGDRCCLSVLGESNDGELCATNRLGYGSQADSSLFVETGLRVEPLLS